MRNMRSINHHDVQQDILVLNAAASHQAPEKLHQIYDHHQHDLLNKYAPEKSITVTLRPDSPWITNDIIQEKRKRRILELKWRKTRLVVHREMFTSQRDRVNKLIQQAKIAFYEEKVSECGNDQKALFKIVKGLLGTTNNSLSHHI